MGASLKRRVFAISDLHLDYAVNLQWLSELPMTEFQNDVLLLAGDISDSPKLLAFCFYELSRRFHRVMYVPGNHDLWVLRYDKELDSLQKWELVKGLAIEYGVLLKPWHDGPLSIVPLLSWYDFSFGMPSATLQDAWMDFHACKWPQGWQVADVARYFFQANEFHLQNMQFSARREVISFSHFMPRIDIMPDAVPHARRMIYPVLGAHALDVQLRQLRPMIHVYGHSHLNRSVSIDGVHYINNAFGYPQESGIAAKRLLCIHEYTA